LRARATAAGIEAVAKAIAEGKDAAQNAISLSVAEKYVDAFSKLAKEGTAVVVPGNVGDMAGMIATALSVYGKVGSAQEAREAARKILEQGKVIEAGEEGHDIEGELRGEVEAPQKTVGEGKRHGKA
jgi:ribosomal protein L18E